MKSAHSKHCTGNQQTLQQSTEINKQCNSNNLLSLRNVIIGNRCAFIMTGFVCYWRDSPQRARAFSFTRFLDHTQRRTTVGTTPLNEWSVRRRDLYLPTHNNHNRQTSMHPVGFEPTISAGERPQTYALDRAATGTGYYDGDLK